MDLKIRVYNFKLKHVERLSFMLKKSNSEVSKNDLTKKLTLDELKSVSGGDGDTSSLNQIEEDRRQLEEQQHRLEECRRHVMVKYGGPPPQNRNEQRMVMKYGAPPPPFCSLQ